MFILSIFISITIHKLFVKTPSSTKNKRVFTTEIFYVCQDKQKRK
ncbi:hypothetical protein MADA3029_910103 [Vibrio nigripulchritudo MADA3029]|nr:hypothetical protein VIBNIMADA3020_810103 [Vibrio nigripulchritudo MADA3020]CCN56406.1 hypothetical protein VIBNIMADA3021_950015 [Vibrio nigripulchritudo MADA3021]CCN62101.1 hypothetical protein MADA3029_910103 [Vibrio nigripulchritudo MADA3029]